jgi:hypothetical protein
MRSALVLLAIAIASCTHASEPAPPSGPPTPSEAVAATTAPAPGAVPVAASTLGYPWLAAPPSPGSSLADRFAPPPGFARVAVDPASFGGWLRTLPLEAPGTPVKSYRGRVILPPDHDNLAAVVALDVGDGDLQQCADSIIRLHAEWLFASGRRDASYRAASSTELPFARWARGERIVPRGDGIVWKPLQRPDASHASYRRWLDEVFAWANTGSLARDTQRVASSELRAGDFVVQAGAPGHAVLVLDVALAADGRRALLLGQGFMPAQSFQVLRPSKGSPDGAWFVTEPGASGLETPFWPAFPWRTLRRFAGT